MWVCNATVWNIVQDMLQWSVKMITVSNSALMVTSAVTLVVLVLTTRAELLFWFGDGGGLSRSAAATGQHPAGGWQHHAASTGQGQHRAGPDWHGAPVWACSLAASGPGEAGSCRAGEVIEPAGGCGCHGDRCTEGAAQRLREWTGTTREVNRRDQWRF